MGRLAEQMMELRHKMRALADERQQMIAELKNSSKQRRQETRQNLANFRRERAETAEPFLRELHQQRQKNIQFIQNLKSDTARMLDGFRQELDENTRHHYEKIKAPTAERRESIYRQLTVWERERSEQAAQLREDLTTFRAKLLASMPDFECLAEKRSAAVANIRAEVQELQQNSRKELAAAARADSTERQQFVHSIQQEVATLQQSAQMARHEMISELNDMRRALRGELPLQHQSLDTPNVSSGTDLGGLRKQEIPTLATDDLTRISGIGPVRARLLQASGIYTFASLSQCTVEELKAVVGDSGVLADIEQWIVEANKLCI